MPGEEEYPWQKVRYAYIRLSSHFSRDQAGSGHLLQLMGLCALHISPWATPPDLPAVGALIAPPCVGLHLPGMI